jgi:3-oxoacyl-[acyl-carrier protein] reductase
MDLGLAGRVAVVLGSTSGLGRASAEALAAEGAHLVVVGRRAELVESLSAALPSAVGVTADLLEEDAPARVAAAAREAFGGVDVLVLNGGGPKPGAALDLDVDDVRTAIELLLTPHVAMVREVLPAMREAGWGRIIAVGSTSVQQPNPILAASNLGRAALAAYLKTLAGDVARDGVTVNMVLPGRIETDRVVSLDQYRAERTGSTPEAVRHAAEDEIPIGRYGRADEFAAVVAFLAGEQAAYVTGEQVRCDGGLVAGY